MGSVPGSRFGTGGDTTAALRSQADSVQAELAKRKTAATAATDPIDQIQAVLGESFVVLPRFRLGAASADGAALDAALGGTAQLLGGDDDAVVRWLQQLTHVRGAGRGSTPRTRSPRWWRAVAARAPDRSVAGARTGDLIAGSRSHRRRATRRSRPGAWRWRRGSRAPSIPPSGWVA